MGWPPRLAKIGEETKTIAEWWRQIDIRAVMKDNEAKRRRALVRRNSVSE